MAHNSPTFDKLGVTAGDIKQGLQAADHGGWVLLDGRLKTALIATQQTAATTLGIGANLPNALGRVLKKKASALLTTGGSNTATIAQANLPNINLTAASAGDHSHIVTTMDNGGQNDVSVSQANNQTPNSGVPTSTAGAHIHTVPLGGSGAALVTENAWLNVNAFLYLGA